MARDDYPHSKNSAGRRPSGLEYVTAVDPVAPDAEAIEGAVDTLLNGGVVAVATDTVYGLAVNATNARAARRLYDLKGREEARPIPLLIGDMKALRHITPLRDENVLALLNIFWPGPLTAVLPKYPRAFKAVSGAETIGVRMPDHPVILRVLRSIRRPLAVTSANASGAEAATSAEAAREAFGDRLDLILDSGATPGPTPSTVLDLSRRPYRILREGIIVVDELLQYLDESELDLGG